ncbi:MAG TPA: DUF302 domain-containing protein [Acidiferrobacter sp.]|nr:DUF302 domain-containing protein [Acidiferrobacter sp.]
MKKLSIFLMTALLFSSSAFAANGIIKIRSAYSVKTTEARLISNLKAKGMTVFLTVDHTAGAARVGLKLRPTELVIFGNPKVGTPLMQCSQSMGIDLPQKALIMEDARGRVWYLYNSPKYMAKRHHMRHCGAAVAKVSHALAMFAKEATSK